MTSPSDNNNPSDASVRQNYELLSAHLDNLPLAVVEWDAEFRIARWSNQAEELFGWREREVKGRHPDDFSFVHIDDQERVAQTMANLLARDERRNLSVNYNYTKSGELVECEWHNSAQVDAEGNLVSILSVVRDITERRATERRKQALLEQEQLLKEQFRTIFESAPGLYLALTPDELRIEGVSDAYLKATFTTRETIHGKCMTDVFPLKKGHRGSEAVKNLITSFERVKRYRQQDILPVQMYPIRNPASKQWEDRYWSVINVPVFDTRGDIQFILHRVEDVTDYVIQQNGHGADAPLNLSEIEVIKQSNELKQLMERYRSGEAYWRSLFADAATGILQAGLDGKIQHANKAFCWMLGYQEEELKQKSFLELTHPAEVDACQEIVDRIVRGEESSAVTEKRFIDKTGKTVWARVSVSMQRDMQLTPVALVALVEDITSQREAENRSQSLEMTLQRSLENMADAFFLLDKNWHFTYLNSEAERVLLKKPGELLGKNMWDEFADAAGSLAYREYHRAMDTGEAVHFEYYYPPLSHWFEINAYPSEEGLAVYFRTITEKKRLMQQLADSEERLSYLARATVDAIRDWDLVNGQVWWSEGITHLFGYRKDELAEGIDAWRELIHPEDRDQVWHALEAALADNRCDDWQARYQFRRKDNTYAHVEDRALLVRQADRAVRLVGGMTDITEAITLEAQLQESQRMESIGHLTGGLAHDFNNLLTVIIGNTDLLTDFLSDNPRLQPLAQSVSAAAQRGAELTQRLLAFSRRQTLAPEMIDVNELINSLVTLLCRTLGDHIELKFIPGDGLWQAMIDAAQLESSLLNLCFNARDAMPRGGRLTIETSNVHLDGGYTQNFLELTPGDYVCMAVSDTGSGIAPENRDRIFEPFFTTKETGKGTGLGLSMVFGFLKQSGGHVNVYSEVGEGTTFKLYLPRVTDNDQVITSNNQHPQTLGGDETILVVEDDSLVRDFVITQLAMAGYQTQEASDGPEALQLLKTQTPVDLLFTDVMMPGGMSGRDLAEAAQKLRPGLAVLYTSGYTENTIVHQGRLDEGVHLLSKPYRPTELLGKVRQVLDENASH